MFNFNFNLKLTININKKEQKHTFFSVCKNLLIAFLSKLKTIINHTSISNTFFKFLLFLKRAYPFIIKYGTLCMLFLVITSLHI